MRQDRVFAIKWASLYPMYVKKAEAKGRTRDELDQVIRWLTGYTPAGLREQLDSDNDLETFFGQAPAFSPNAALIKGVVCGIRVEEIEHPLMRKSATSTNSSTSWPRARRSRRSCAGESAETSRVHLTDLAEESLGKFLTPESAPAAGVQDRPTPKLAEWHACRDLSFPEAGRLASRTRCGLSVPAREALSDDDGPAIRTHLQ